MAISFALVTLASSPLATSGADIWYRIRVDPEHPRFNEQVAVQVQTFMQMQQLCLDEVELTPEPVEVTLYGNLRADPDMMEARAIGPDDQRFQFHLHRSTNDPSVWKGNVAFPAPGEWSLILISVRGEMTNLPIPDHCTGTAILLNVLPVGGTPAASPVATPSAESNT